jgi:hypothetical protein
MSAKEEQLIQLLGLMARSMTHMTHMTASVTAMAFEQLRSQDAALQSSAKRMIERMQAINEELDQQWETGRPTNWSAGSRSACGGAGYLFGSSASGSGGLLRSVCDGLLTPDT